MTNSYGKPLTFREWWRYYLPYRLSTWWREVRWHIPVWLRPKSKWPEAKRQLRWIIVEEVDGDWRDF